RPCTPRRMAMRNGCAPPPRITPAKAPPVSSGRSRVSPPQGRGQNAPRRPAGCKERHQNHGARRRQGTNLANRLLLIADDFALLSLAPLCPDSPCVTPPESRIFAILGAPVVPRGCRELNQEIRNREFYLRFQC